MKNKILAYSAAALLMAGCQADNIDYDQDSGGEQGALAVAITKADEATEESEDITLRIYNTNDRLIARYSGDEIPEAIYLAEDDYKATVFIGSQAEISYDKADLSYYGEQEFSVVGGQVSSLDINCTLQNTVVSVTFDQSVFDRFELEATCYLCLSNTFSKDDAIDGSVPTLKFDDDGSGYFILPEGVDNISWGFYGLSESIDPTTIVPSKEAEFSGAIEAPKAATEYTLNLVYSMTPDGYMTLMATIDESIEELDDNLGFSPQPTIVGQDFNMSAQGLVFTGEALAFDIKSISELADITISSDSLSYDITVMENGTIASNDGVSYAASSTTTGVLTLDKQFFCQFGYGVQELKISATDIVESTGYEQMEILLSGTESAVFDMWNNTATFAAQVVIDNPTQVKYEYKTKDAQVWTEIAATKGSGYSYTAAIEPTWSEGVNDAGLAVYTFSGGITTSTTYEYRLIVDGVEYKTLSTTTIDGTTIPNGDMEDSNIKAFGTSSSSSSDWASGNNTFASSLCAQKSLSGSNCAYLKSTTTSIGSVFAAGNLAFGQFEMDSFSGDMRFGQSFDWDARPRKFKFRYAATIGAETNDTNNLLDGTDRARVFFAVVDWSARQTVTASTSGNPTGAWDPASQTKADYGNIIGYASLFIDQSTTTTELHQAELEIFYYDTVTQPSGNITIVISCAASAYGDYMTGSTGSALWVDDFELVY